MIKSEGWGTAEIVAASLYLRDERLVRRQWKNKKYKSDPLSIRAYYYKIIDESLGKAEICKDDNFFNLGYRFFLKKEKNILIDPNLLGKSLKIELSKLNSTGIYIRNKQNHYKETFDLYVTSDRNYKSSKRNLVISKNDCVKIKSLKNSNDLKDTLWRMYDDSLNLKTFTLVEASKQDPDNLNLFPDESCYLFNHGSSKFNEFKFKKLRKLFCNNNFYFYSSKFNGTLKNSILNVSKTKTMLKEAFKTKILVLDERIQISLNQKH